MNKDEGLANRRRRLWRPVAMMVILYGLVGAVLAPSPAMADGVRAWNTNPDGVLGVSATGRADYSTASNGNIKCRVRGTIHDTRGDGHRVGVEISYRNGSSKRVRIYHTGGVGTSRTFDLTKYSEWPVDIREFVAEGGSIVKAGDWETVCGSWGCLCTSGQQARRSDDDSGEPALKTFGLPPTG